MGQATQQAKLPVITPGYARAAESLAYISHFERGAAGGWKEQRNKPALKSARLAEILEPTFRPSRSIRRGSTYSPFGSQFIRHQRKAATEGH